MNKSKKEKYIVCCLYDKNIVYQGTDEQDCKEFISFTINRLMEQLVVMNLYDYENFIDKNTTNKNRNIKITKAKIEKIYH